MTERHHAVAGAGTDDAPRYSGSRQPARRALGISAITLAAGTIPVAQRDLITTPFFTLIELAADDGPTRPDILVVPPLSGHFSMLMRDLVIGLLAKYRVAILDWTNVRHVPMHHGCFGLDDNVTAVRAALRRLAKPAGVIGVCQGGVAALAASALMAAAREPATPRALVLLGAPIDPMANPTRVVHLLRAQPLGWYADTLLGKVWECFPGHGRAIYPAEHQLAGLTGYLSRQLAEGSEFVRKVWFDDGRDPTRFPFLDLYTSIMDIDAAHFVENLARVYQERALANGSLSVFGEPVVPAAMRRTAIMSIEGERDDIAAPGQTSAALHLCSEVPPAMRRRVVIPEAGHFSLFHGTTFRRSVLPEIETFLDGV